MDFENYPKIISDAINHKTRVGYSVLKQCKLFIIKELILLLVITEV